MLNRRFYIFCPKNKAKRECRLAFSSCGATLKKKIKIGFKDLPDSIVKEITSVTELQRASVD